MEVLIAVDAGTTGVRSVAFDLTGSMVANAYRELPQYFPAPGLVEHDAATIWELVEETLAELVATLRSIDAQVLAVGLTNQRETAVAWDRRSGAPLHRAIVWQDRRTVDRCEAAARAGHLPLVRARTGLVLDPYFSATKWAFMLEEGGVKVTPELALGTVDSWVLWNLTGGRAEDGAEEGNFVTDVTNASRTLCFDIGRLEWSAELCEIFGVPLGSLAEVKPSCGRFGTISPKVAGGALAGVPVSGVAGDQQAALFGQGCLSPGDTKVTYGTGTFVLMNVGTEIPEPVEGLLTTVAWDLGAADESADATYALEGAIFVTGATIQWLRDGLGLISRASEVGPLAASIPSSEGVYLVPAFTGLGSPWWDPDARGTITGLTRGAGKAHLARAAVEAIAYQTRDVLDAMTAAASRAGGTLYADGGASVMDLLLQLQADQSRVPVVRRGTAEITALGAALLAGIAEGAWAGPEQVRHLLDTEATFDASASQHKADVDYSGWRRAVERSRGWAKATS